MVNIVNIPKTVLLQKERGETPLECLKRFRAAQIAAGHVEYAAIPMTYAGRLDPAASGALLVLLDDECKNKDQYLGLDKEYEVEIVFGIETDTADLLGMITKVMPASPRSMSIAHVISEAGLHKYVGAFEQSYPAYSSKTVGGRQLHALAREGNLPEADEMPKKRVEIYSIEEIGWRILTGAEIAADANTLVNKVTGDFRQKDISECWKKCGLNSATRFQVLGIRVACSSGTYMRSLAERIGRDAGTGALALSIHRTKIANFS